MKPLRSILANTLFASAVLLFSSFSVPVYAQEPTISWQVDEEEYLVYKGSGNVQDPFGYEVNGKYPTPKLVSRTKQVPFYLSLILPNKPVQEGASYEINRTLPNFNPIVPATVQGKGERRSNKTRGEHEVYHLHHTLKVGRPQNLVHDDFPFPFCRAGIMEIDIYYDPELGAIREMTWEAKLKIEPNNAKISGDTINQSGSYKLERHHPIGENDFQKRVDQAIKRGVESLRAAVNNGNDWNVNENWWYGKSSRGFTAILFLALIESGLVEEDSSLFKSGMKYLFGKTNFNKPGDPDYSKKQRREKLDRNFHSTYKEALRLMIMEAYYHSDTESNVAQRLRQGESLSKEFHTQKVKMNPSDRDWVQSVLNWLFQNLKDGALRYPGNSGYDNSNTQYGALAMYAALNLQIQVNPDLIKNMLFHWVRTQQKQGQQVDVTVASLGAYETRTIKQATARGWGYNRIPKPNDHYGHHNAARMHMTAGAVGSIMILRTYLKHYDSLGGKLDRVSKKALEDGLAWMNHNWQLRPYPSVTGNYRDLHNSWEDNKAHWQYYCLYAVERAGMLNNVGTIGPHKWYPEGAEMLLTRQEKWTMDIVDTAFAILFLKRATSPIIDTED